MEDTEREDTEEKNGERKDRGELLEDGHVCDIKTVGRDNHLILGELFGIFQGEVYCVVLVAFDDDLFLHPVAVKAQALNSNEILAGRNFGNSDPIVEVGFKYFYNNTSSRTVVAIEYDQNGILAP
jgi:hypothetical protein